MPTPVGFDYLARFSNTTERDPGRRRPPSGRRADRRRIDLRLDFFDPLMRIGFGLVAGQAAEGPQQTLATR